ncbi:kininogen-1 [Brachyhypopomus gauderio]|uniref:kininogen-1 n=1 Tax=Brachyhypopomus gauderio TaxID=698409 RepID=UPI00404216EB
MKGDKLCLLFALSCLFYVGSHGQAADSLSCGDKNVEEAVRLVLLMHNKGLTEGGQLALYQILKATKAHNDSGDVISVSFTGRETDCPAGGDKDWDQCDYLNDTSKIASLCHAKVLHKETNEVISFHCLDTLVVPKPRPPCLGCPMNIDVNSEDLKEPLSYSLSKANRILNHPHFFVLKSIYLATRQVIAGFRYRLEFDMQKSNCTKSEFKEVTEECHPDHEAPSFMNCNSTVDVAPWRLELPETHVQCAEGLSQRTILRRPPGWSPLRNIQIVEAQQQPSTKPHKEESSEESHEGKALPGPPASPDQDPTAPLSQPPSEASSATLTTAPSCPSKPWKEFKPAIRGPPPPPSNKTESGLSDAESSG